MVTKAQHAVDAGPVILRTLGPSKGEQVCPLKRLYLLCLHRLKTTQQTFEICGHPCLVSWEELIVLRPQEGHNFSCARGGYVEVQVTVLVEDAEGS